MWKTIFPYAGYLRKILYTGSCIVSFDDNGKETTVNPGSNNRFQMAVECLRREANMFMERRHPLGGLLRKDIFDILDILDIEFT